MLAYPIELEEEDGSVIATSIDFPELKTFGDDDDDALAHAADALEEAIAARMHYRKDIPLPSRGDNLVPLPTLASAKVILYRTMRENGIGKAELSRRLGCHMPQVDRLLDLNHNSRMSLVDAAMHAVGLRLSVSAVPIPTPLTAIAEKPAEYRSREG